MKRCPRCGVTKSLEEFAKNRTRKDGRQAWCRLCKKAYDKADYHAHKSRRDGIARRNKDNKLRNYRFVYRYLSIFVRACEQCGERDIRTFVFHHIDTDTKIKTIAQMCHGGFRLSRLKAEIKKCSVICANCHFIEHYSNPWVNRLNR